MAQCWGARVSRAMHATGGLAHPFTPRMNTDRSAAKAILVGIAAGLATMLLHPTGHDVLREASAGRSNALAAGVHWLAILAQPLVLAGTLALTLRLRARRDLAIGAFVFFAFGSVMVIVAAVMSGLVAPAVLRGIGEADEAARALRMAQLRHTGLMNQAFAAVYVVSTGIAILLWSWAMLVGREIARGLAVYGLILGAALTVGVLSGVLHLGIHGFLLVVLGVGAWMGWVAVWLWHSEHDSVKD